LTTHITRTGSEHTGKGVSHMAVKIYNALPSDLKGKFSIPNIFKSKLKDFLYNNSFYTLDEFFNRWSIYCYKDLLSAITNDHLHFIHAIDWEFSWCMYIISYSC
jgi:hypothetical protein